MEVSFSKQDKRRRVVLAVRTAVVIIHYNFSYLEWTHWPQYTSVCPSCCFRLSIADSVIRPFWDRGRFLEQTCFSGYSLPKQPPELFGIVFEPKPKTMELNLETRPCV